MDFELTKDSLASIVSIIAPGYLAIQVYAAVYSKARKDFTQLLLESVVYGLIIVAAYNTALKLMGVNSANILAFWYYAPLLALAGLSGLSASYMRRRRFVQDIASRLNLPTPDDDFLRDTFSHLSPGSVVTVTLKDNTIFSGTLESIEVGSQIARPEQRLVFGNLAWYRQNRRQGRWDARPGNLIVAFGEILHIETDLPLNK